MYRQAFNNLVIAPTEFALLRDQKSTERLHQSLAREAFEELQREHPRRQLTTDYRDGFEHGYNAYLTTGGDTSPALLPPRKYWSVKWRTGTENEAARNWLAGERDGREHAAASGLRTLATAPSSLELEPDEGNPPESQIEELPALSGKPKLKPGSDAAKSDSRSATVDRGRIN